MYSVNSVSILSVYRPSKDNIIQYHWLLVWNDFYFPYIGNVIIPTDELIFFRGGRYTTNQIQSPMCIGRTA